jgi:hypothetical protein
MKPNQCLVHAPYGRSDSRRDAAPAAQAWRYENYTCQALSFGKK